MVQFPITFTPSRPVNFDGNTYRRLNFNRPIGMAEIIVAEPFEDAIEQMTAVTASLADVPVAVIKRMSIDDQIRLAVTVEPILALPPQVA